MKYASMADFVSKMDWEGGLYDFVIGCGVSVHELPDDMPEDIKWELEWMIANRDRFWQLSSTIYTFLEEE